MWNAIKGSLLKAPVSQFNYYFDVFPSNPLFNKIEIFLHIYILFYTLKSASEAFFHVDIISHAYKNTMIEYILAY